MSSMKFMEACLEGDALLEEIDDYIDEWHDGDSEEDLHEYLGMTFEEYSVWVENDAMLKTIFNARVVGKSIIDLIKENDVQKLVARASTPEEAAQVREWLKRKGLLSRG